MPGGWSLVSRDDEDAAAPEPVAAPDAEPHRVAEARETLERLATAIAALPVAQREVFLLRVEADLTVAGDRRRDRKRRGGGQEPAALRHEQTARGDR